MSEENQLTKLFETNEILILREVDENDKNQFYFKAADLGKILGITNIHSSIQHLSEKEKGIRKIYTIKGDNLLLC